MTVVVFKVLSQDKVQQRLVCKTLTFPFVEAFAVFSQDRVRRSVLWSSSLTVLLEVFKIFSPRSGLYSFILWSCG